MGEAVRKTWEASFCASLCKYTMRLTTSILCTWKVEVHGEGDGCDRCGCPDEEKCCPSFWNDRSVPPIWPLSWAFDPHNPYLNDNKCARSFGNIGFPFFDRERKAFLGVALAVTVLSIVSFFSPFSLVLSPP